MRHGVFGRKLNRDIKKRKALFKNLIISLIIHGRIRTTLAKAKAIRGLVEKLVNHAKNSSNSSIRKISAIISRKGALDKLRKEIAPRFANRIGGFLRIRRIGRRIGDSSEEVFLEWVEDEDKKIKDKEIKDKKPKTKNQKHKFNI